LHDPRLEMILGPADRLDLVDTGEGMDRLQEIDRRTMIHEPLQAGSGRRESQQLYLTLGPRVRQSSSRTQCDRSPSTIPDPSIERKPILGRRMSVGMASHRITRRLFLPATASASLS